MLGADQCWAVPGSTRFFDECFVGERALVLGARTTTPLTCHRLGGAAVGAGAGVGTCAWLTVGGRAGAAACAAGDGGC